MHRGSLVSRRVEVFTALLFSKIKQHARGPLLESIPYALAFIALALHEETS